MSEQDKIISDLRMRLEKANASRFNLYIDYQKLRIELAESGISKIDKDMLNTLIRLAHPDKHNNSEASTRATKFLLKMRK